MPWAGPTPATAHLLWLLGFPQCRLCGHTNRVTCTLLTPLPHLALLLPLDVTVDVLPLEQRFHYLVDGSGLCGSGSIRHLDYLCTKTNHLLSRCAVRRLPTYLSTLPPRPHAPLKQQRLRARIFPPAAAYHLLTCRYTPAARPTRFGAAAGWSPPLVDLWRHLNCGSSAFAGPVVMVRLGILCWLRISRFAHSTAPPSPLAVLCAAFCAYFLARCTLSLLPAAHSTSALRVPAWHAHRAAASAPTPPHYRFAPHHAPHLLWRLPPLDAAHRRQLHSIRALYHTDHTVVLCPISLLGDCSSHSWIGHVDGWN